MARGDCFVEVAMRKIGLLSDTHGWIDPQIVEFFKDCDEVWHCGDIGDYRVFEKLEADFNFSAVYGNIDGGIIRRVYHDFILFEREGVRVLMTHIGGYPRHYSSRALQHIHASRPQLFVAGHSHILRVEYDKVYDMLFVNPGAAGNYGVHHVRTAIRLDIEHGEIKNMEIGEWHKHL